MRSLKKNSVQNLDIQFKRTYTLEKTLRQVKENNHTDSIVIISILTNNAKRRQVLSYVRRIQEEIILKLKTETDASNIIFLGCPPAQYFETKTYNQATQNLCGQQGVQFAKNLVLQKHLKNDGIHINSRDQHFMSRSVAEAAILCSKV